MKYTEMYFYSRNAVTVLGGRFSTSIKYLNEEGRTPVPVAERALPLQDKPMFGSLIVGGTVVGK